MTETLVELFIDVNETVMRLSEEMHGFLRHLISKYKSLSGFENPKIAPPCFVTD